MSLEEHGEDFTAYRSIEEWKSSQKKGPGTWVALDEREIEVAGTSGVMIFAKWDFDCDYWVDVCEGPDPGPLNQVDTVFVLDGRLYVFTLHGWVEDFEQRELETYEQVLASLRIF
jgi:hypothetical protein